MAWSAKILSGSGGVSGVNEFELVYDAASQTDYKLRYGFSLGGDAPEVLYHTPDNGSPVPVRAFDRNRLIFLEMHIPAQANWDEVMNNITRLNRLVNGANSQALRAQTVGDADVVKVAIKPDGATYTTYYDVIEGFVDTSLAYTEAQAVLNTMAYTITIGLTCKPYGYGSSITLQNRLPSSPHMLLDSNSDGLADGLTKLNAGTITSISTARYLSGGKSQYVEVDAASSMGLNFATLTLSAGTQIHAYIDVNFNSGDSWLFQIVDGGGAITATVTVNAAGTSAARVFTSPTGHTFHRYHLSGTNVSANAYIRIYRDSASATQAGSIYIDKAYMGTGSLTNPVAFASTRAWYNRHDPSIATTNINTIDVWGVPGDAPALVKLAYTHTSGSALLMRAWRWHDGNRLAANVPHIYDSTDVTNVFSAWTTGTGTNGNHYYALPSGTATGNLYKTINWYTYRQMPVSTLAVVRANHLDVQFQMLLETSDFSLGGGVTLWSSEIKKVSTINTWQLIEFGTIPPGIDTADGINVYLRLQVTNAASRTADFDFFVVSPSMDSSRIIAKTTVYSGASATGYNMTIDGENEVVTGGTSGGYNQSYLGAMWHAAPGVMNRYMILYTDNNALYNVATVGTISMTVTPRTYHLLGTI